MAIETETNELLLCSHSDRVQPCAVEHAPGDVCRFGRYRVGHREIRFAAHENQIDSEANNL